MHQQIVFGRTRDGLGLIHILARPWIRHCLLIVDADLTDAQLKAQQLLANYNWMTRNYTQADLFKAQTDLAEAMDQGGSMVAQLRRREPEHRSVREFVLILKLHRDYPAADIAHAIQQALTLGRADLEGVRLCLHQLHEPTSPAARLDLSGCV